MGDTIELGGGFSLSVIHTPGHTPGTATFVAGRQRLAFTGDAAQGWGTGLGRLPIYFDAGAYLSSLNRLRELRVETLCMGHPFRWSRSDENASPIRSGADVTQTLDDSMAFVRDVDRATAGVQASDTAHPVDQVKQVFAELDPRFSVEVGADGRFPASNAAAVFAHLERHGKRQASGA